MSKNAKGEIADEAKNDRETGREYKTDVSHLAPVEHTRLTHRIEDEKRVVMTHEAKGHDGKRVGEAVKVAHRSILVRACFRTSTRELLLRNMVSLLMNED